MGLQAPDRSLLGAFYRSQLEARATGVSGEPEPPPPEPVLGCCYTWCNVGSVINHDPEFPCSTGLDCRDDLVTGLTSQNHEILSLSSIPSYKNFPYNMRQADGTDWDYPWNCDPSDWTNFAVAITEGPRGWRFVPFLSGGFIPEMSTNECGALGAVFNPTELGIVRFEAAEWTITAFNTPTQIEIGFNRLSEQALIRIVDNGPNDGEYRVDVSSGDLTYVTITEPVPAPGTPGGKVLLITSVYRLVVFYSAVADPPGNLYTAFLDTTTGVFSVNDTEISILNAAPYNGVQTVTYISDTRVELGALFDGRPPAGGTWVNNATVLTVPAGAYDGNPRVKVIGAAGFYDGEYEAGEWSTTGENPDLLLFDTFFQGNDSGTVTYSGLLLTLANGPPSTFFEGTVIVSGTGLYDGIYPGAFVFIGGDGIGQCFIAQPFFVGNATGTLTIPDLGGATADITNIEEDFPGDSFTAASAQRFGDVAEIAPEVMRVSCETVGQWALGQDAVLISHTYQTNHPYDFTGRPIQLVGDGFVDVAGTFTVNDAGAMGIRPP